ncbi:MAG: type II toxin-antitoxin system Phd/YefM family antitoxin [Terriglobales bacterium]
MTEVGVRDLKNRLSEHLRQVKAGHEILVTEHGRRIAKLCPVEPAPEWLQEMVRNGEVSWSGGKPRGANIRLRGKGPLASDYVREWRGRY